MRQNHLRIMIIGTNKFNQLIQIINKTKTLSQYKHLYKNKSK